MPDFYTPYMPNQLAITMASQVGQQAANMADIQRLQQQMSQSSQMFPYQLSQEQTKAQYAPVMASNQAAITGAQAQYAPQIAEGQVYGTPFQQKQLEFSQQLARQNAERQYMLAQSLMGRRNVENSKDMGLANKPVWANGVNGPGFYWPQGSPQGNRLATPSELDYLSNQTLSGGGIDQSGMTPQGGGSSIPSSPWVGQQPIGAFQGNAGQIAQGIQNSQLVNGGTEQDRAEALQALRNQIGEQGGGVPPPGRYMTPQQLMEQYNNYTTNAKKDIAPIDQIREKAQIIKQLIATNNPESWQQAERVRADLMNIARSAGTTFQQKEMENLGTMTGRLAGFISNFLQGTGTEQQRENIRNTLDNLETNTLSPIRGRIIEQYQQLAKKRGLPDPSQIYVPDPYASARPPTLAEIDAEIARRQGK